MSSMATAGSLETRAVEDEHLRSRFESEALPHVRTDYWRRAGRRPRMVELTEEECVSVPPPQEALASGHESILRALDHLPEAFRSAVVLRDMEDFSYAEIAQILSVPVGTVMSRIHRGRALLRGALQAPAAHPTRE